MTSQDIKKEEYYAVLRPFLKNSVPRHIALLRPFLKYKKYLQYKSLAFLCDLNVDTIFQYKVNVKITKQLISRTSFWLLIDN